MGAAWSFHAAGDPAARSLSPSPALLTSTDAKPVNANKSG
jgi:hypothetical protein